jgi:hypothetical protein
MAGAYVTMRAMSTRALALVAAVALVAGCGDDDEDAPPPRATAPAAGIDPLAGASTRPVTAAATNRATALLADVRAARHEGYDRVVFEFRNELPGYSVRYVRPPVHADGSGDVVPVDGDFVVEVRMENALDADLSKPSAPLTYTGPRRLAPATPVVAELARTGGFEGVLTWVVGLRDRVGFRVTTLQSPPRLVVDFRNH